jgi:anti-sigma B factor antagonist
MTVRKINPKASIIDIKGAMSATSENALMDSYAEASTHQTRAIILNFNELEYLNSSGIGLLVTFLIRANRQQQRLFAFGLNDHYRHIFELTRLNEAIGIYDDEMNAVAAASKL